MKRFDDSTKKLIKNVAALVTSALVLIAATIAWFSVGSKAGVDSVGAKFENRQYSVTYYRMKDTVLSGAVLNEATVGGSSPSFTFGTARVPENELADANWDTAENFNIDSLEPGSFRAFKIHVESSVSTLPCLVANSVLTSASGADRETVLKNVYAYGIVLQTTTTTTPGGEGEDPQTETTLTPRGTFCGSLNSMLNSNGKLSQRMTTGQVTGSYDVLLYIGVPGESVTTVTVDVNQNETSSVDNLRDAHDALRQIGSTVTLNQISING